MQLECRAAVLVKGARIMFMLGPVGETVITSATEAGNAAAEVIMHSGQPPVGLAFWCKSKRWAHGFGGVDKSLDESLKARLA